MLKLYHEVTGFRHKSCRTEQTQQRKNMEQQELPEIWPWSTTAHPCLGLLICGWLWACGCLQKDKKRAFSYCLSHTIQCPPDRNRPGQIWILSSSLRGGEFSWMTYEKWVSPKHGSRIRYHNLVYSRNLNGGNHDDPSIHFLCRALVLSSPDLHLSSICMWLNSFSTKLEACEYILDQQVARYFFFFALATAPEMQVALEGALTG